MQKTMFTLLLLFLLLEFYVYQAFKMIYTGGWTRWLYWIITGLVYAFLFWAIFTVDRGSKSYFKVQLIVSLILIFVFPKLLAAVFLLLEDLFRLSKWGYQYVVGEGQNLSSRRRFISLVGLGSAGVLSLLFLDGIVFGKYRYRVRTVRLKFPNLPQAFKGYKVVQISDVHSGSFRNPQQLQHAIDLINKQEADLVLFTGDMVNNYAEEFVTFVDLFKQIKAKDGKFSVLGNHDYGDYGEWESLEAKKQNIVKLAQYEGEAGFEMLRNEHRKITRGGESIYLIGVENWGIAPFPQFGDLDLATRGIPTEAVKILMSHDPSHFDAKVLEHPSNIQLTLSGHTHGMQFGLDLKNVKWSPVKYKYPKWVDLYKTDGKFLYVNRGFGVIAYPGRVGVLPEITVFELE